MQHEEIDICCNHISRGADCFSGVDFMITPEISVFAEYKYSRASFELEGEIGIDLDYEASQVYGGVSYHFN